MRRTLVMIPIVVLLFVGAVQAETIYLRGGGTLEGQVISLTEENLVMTIEGVEGSKVELPLSRVSDYSLYELKRARIDPDSVAEHEALGDWAMEREMLTFAMDQYRLAVDMAGDEATSVLKEKLEEASSRCGADKLARGKKLVEAGELVEARNFFKDILENHPECAAAKTAREQVEQLDKRIEQQRKKARERRRAQERALSIEQGLSAAKERIERGQRMRRQGLLESGSLGQAENAYLKAIESLERARSILAQVRKLPDARQSEQEIQTLVSRVEELLVQVYVDIGHNFIVKGNLIRANHYMGLALAIDPNDPKALALRSDIAVASGEDNWGRRLR